MTRSILTILDFLRLASISIRVSRLIGNEQYDDVIALLERRTGPGPNGTYAHSILALCYEFKADPESALFHATQVLLVDPYDAVSLKIAVNHHLVQREHDAVYQFVLRYLHAPQEELAVPTRFLDALALVGFSRLANTVRESIGQSAARERQYLSWATAFKTWYERGKPQPPPLIH